jgi:hypothetical protein
MHGTTVKMKSHTDVFSSQGNNYLAVRKTSRAKGAKSFSSIFTRVYH